MANTDIVAGFKPVKYLNGSPWTGKARMYYIPSSDGTATFIGDAVISAGSADTLGKYATVKQAAAGEAIRGIVIGFSDQPHVAFDADNLYRAYRPADTAMYCLVVDDPSVIFEIQEDSDGNSLAATEVGLNTNIVVGSGDTSSGKSAMELDSSDTGTNAQGQCKLLGIVDREDNALGTNAKWEVIINEHEFLSSDGL
jgi:hypothetical protein